MRAIGNIEGFTLGLHFLTLNNLTANFFSLTDFCSEVIHLISSLQTAHTYTYTLYNFSLNIFSMTGASLEIGNWPGNWKLEIRLCWTKK